MNLIQNTLLKTIQYLVKDGISKAGYDCTLTGTVTDIASENKYEVNLQGNKHILNCAVDVHINVADVVFVTLPQNSIINAYISGIKRR